MSTPQGNIPQKFIWQFAGNPTNASVSIINPPKGAIVIDFINAEIYFKTSGYGDNSGFFPIMTRILQATATANEAGTTANTALALAGTKMNNDGSSTAIPTFDPASGGSLWNDANAVKVSTG